MLEQHARHDRVLDLEPVTEVAHRARRAGGGRLDPRQRGAAPLRRRARRGDAQRPAGRARGEPAGGADAVPRREGARGARRPRPRAPRRRPGAGARRCSRTGCCSLPTRLPATPSAVVERGARARPGACRSQRAGRADRGGPRRSRCCSPGPASTRPRCSSPGSACSGSRVVAVAWVELAATAAARRAPGAGAGDRGRALSGCGSARVGAPPAAARRRAQRRACSPRPVALGPRWTRRLERPSVRPQRPRPAPARARRGSRFATRSGSGRRSGRERRARASCSSCRGSSRCSSPGAAPAGHGRARSRGSRTAPRRAASTRARSSSRSTACAPTARAARRRGSTGRRWRAPAS